MALPTIDRYPIEKPKDYKFYEFRMVGGDVVELKRIVAHSFDVPDNSQQYRVIKDAATLMSEWLNTDRGMWVMENAYETPYYDYYKQTDRWNVEFKVVATFTTKKLSEYYLRWS